MLKIGLGTAAIGRPKYINIRSGEESAPFSLDRFRAEGMAMLEAAWQQGVRYYDTAPGYGLAEELMIDWTRGVPGRTLEVATKWGYTYVANFDPAATQHEVKEHSLTKLNEQWALSEQQLPQLTTYQIHSATAATGVLKNEAVLNRLAALKQEHGLLIGLTTTGSAQVELLKKALDVEVGGKQLFDAFQVTFNLLDQSLRSISNELHRQGKRMIIKEALANGRLYPNNAYPHYQALYRKLDELAEKYAVGPDAIVLRYCLDSLDPFVVLSGAAQKDHLTSNLLALGIKLSEEDLDVLNGFGLSATTYWGERKKLGWN